MVGSKTFGFGSDGYINLLSGTDYIGKTISSIEAEGDGENNRNSETKDVSTLNYKVLTREEAAYFIANYFGLSVSNGLAQIPDINQVNLEYRESIKALYENKIVRGISESGIFNPKGKLNKAEASSIISNIIKNRTTN